MRITGGTLARRVIPTQFAKHVRPTTDRVRESLLNAISHNYPFCFNSVLDLYAGSGIVSLECISRESQNVTSIDKDFKNIKAMKEIQKSWNIQEWAIKKQDVASYLKSTNETFDFIFADPPYDAPKLNSLPGMCIPKLKGPGILVLEHQPNIKFDISPTVTKDYGSTVCSIFVKSE